ncbi:unnamed protein product [Polarella glacialis]|uniref:Uncharacterized protein n=1 Tax=Polarella glacialis TaxID=89957 RepID=A0A813FVZ0_POLGL|nr:unnamed protein product [Polarella glacialis]
MKKRLSLSAVEEGFAARLALVEQLLAQDFQAAVEKLSRLEAKLEAMDRRQISVCALQLSDLSTLVRHTSEEVGESCTSDGLQESQHWHGTDERLTCLDAQMEQLMERMEQYMESTKPKRECCIGDDEDAQEYEPATGIASAEVSMSEILDLFTLWESPMRYELNPPLRSLVEQLSAPWKSLVEQLQEDMERLQAQTDETQVQLEMLATCFQSFSDAQEVSSCVKLTTEPTRHSCGLSSGLSPSSSFFFVSVSEADAAGFEDEVRDCIEKCIAASEAAVSSLAPRLLNTAAQSQELGMLVPASSSVQMPITRYKLNSGEDFDTCELATKTAMDRAKEGTRHQHEVPDVSLVQQATSSDSLKFDEHPLKDYEKATWSDADGGVQHEDLEVCKENMKLMVCEAPTSCEVFPSTLQPIPELVCQWSF